MVGSIKHLGQPVQFGGEKEFNLKNMKEGEKLAHTQPANWDPRLLGQVGADMLKAGAAAGVGQVAWQDLNDKGKAQYALAYKAQHGKFPVIRTTPNPDYSEIAFEKNGWIEVISKPFELEGLRNFLKNYGWGHVHTSWMRGAPPAEQRQQLSWMANANLWVFLNSLEQRGASGNGEEGWRFAITGLSIPTEEHLDRAGQILGGQNKVATAFAKHLIVNIRGNGKMYGHPNRIGAETRGGDAGEKGRILDSLLGALESGKWGSVPLERGQTEFRLTRLAGDARKGNKGETLQVKSLPSEFSTQVRAHIERHGVAGLAAQDATRLHNFVASASFYDAETPARLSKFDQRGCIPLLNYEALPFLSDEEKGRAVKARGEFIQKLDALEKTGVRGRDAAVGIANLIADWAKSARLADAFGRWLDGPNGRQNLV